MLHLSHGVRLWKLSLSFLWNVNQIIAIKDSIDLSVRKDAIAAQLSMSITNEPFVKRIVPSKGVKLRIGVVLECSFHIEPLKEHIVILQDGYHRLL